MWDYLWDLNKNRRHMCVWNVRVVIVGGKRKERKKKTSKDISETRTTIECGFLFSSSIHTDTHTVG